MTLSRKAEWTNSDGLVVGFGSRYPERQAQAEYETDGSQLELVLDFTWESTSPKLTVPAQFVVEAAYLQVIDAWVGGTSLTIGDTDADGYLTAAGGGATANLTVGKMIPGDGVIVVPAAGERGIPKVYTAATDINVTVAGTYTAGSARFVLVGRKVR